LPGPLLVVAVLVVVVVLASLPCLIWPRGPVAVVVVVVVVVRSPWLVVLLFVFAGLPLDPCVEVELDVLLVELANLAKAGPVRARARADAAKISVFIGGLLLLLPNQGILLPGPLVAVVVVVLADLPCFTWPYGPVVVDVVVVSPLLVVLLFVFAGLPLDPCVEVEVWEKPVLANAGAEMPKASATAADAMMSLFIVASSL
jgi:hypothetical protein